VFHANEDPIVHFFCLVRSMPTDIADDVLLLPLFAWLKDTPSYNPEGWRLVDPLPNRKDSTTKYLVDFRQASEHPT
jgi:hypothetical protein